MLVLHLALDGMTEDSRDVCCVSQLRFRAIRVSLLVVCISTERISSPAVSTSAAVWMVWWAVCLCVHTTSLCPADTAPARVWRRRRDAAVRSGCVMMITASETTHRTPVPITPHPTTSANSYRALTVFCPGGAPFKVFLLYLLYIVTVLIQYLLLLLLIFLISFYF